MSVPYDSETENTESKSDKPLKRVRFSDEVKDVCEFEGDEESISMEEENSSASVSAKSAGIERKELFASEPMKDSENKTVVDTTLASVRASNVIEPDEPNWDNNNYLYQPVDASSMNVSKPSSESSAASSSVEIDDITDLINETELMDISDPDPGDEEHQYHLTSVELPYSPPKRKLDLQKLTNKELAMKKTQTLSRKRSLEGMVIEKQTSKVNTCLRKSSSEITSADNLKNAVYDAWCEVKTVKKPPRTESPMPGAPKLKIDIPHKTAAENIYGSRKRSKERVRKVCKKLEPVPEKAEDEESKMAFRAWKKKKDELLRQQIAEKYRKEEKERLDSLMNERIRKNDAESAFSAWNAHKAVLTKMERKKSLWFSKREEEIGAEKVNKDNEAAKIYYEWLRSKICSTKNGTPRSVEDKPPWTPPGKGNTFI